MFCVFDHEECGILAPRPGTEPVSPALESEILTTGPPRTSPDVILTWVVLSKETERLTECKIPVDSELF